MTEGVLIALITSFVALVVALGVITKNLLDAKNDATIARDGAQQVLQTARNTANIAATKQDLDVASVLIRALQEDNKRLRDGQWEAESHYNHQVEMYELSLAKLRGEVARLVRIMRAAGLDSDQPEKVGNL